ncbi:thioester reductase domain-containing protein, partial [Neisseriaceae bacterium TC5R-5]|nr:thioester reductase domain-containing protein [Neisseriaceae bacterium TC5R-5]
MTGANGFLGCFILEQLLQQTRAQVVCLVRAGNDEQAQGRLNKALADLGLVALIDHPRILALAGDLSKLQLGLSTSRFDELASTVDVIYHNGAHVNHLYDYNHLYAANVGSTLSLLRLACTGQNKAMHFVSTLSSASRINAAGELEEAGPADAPPRAFVDSGYLLSKWVSERLVWQAASRGMTAAIYRPGNITGHSQLGTCLPDHNRLLRMVKG